MKTMDFWCLAVNFHLYEIVELNGLFFFFLQEMKCTEKKFETYFVVVFFVEKMYEDKSVLGRCCFLC